MLVHIPQILMTEHHLTCPVKVMSKVFQIWNRCNPLTIFAFFPQTLIG